MGQKRVAIYCRVSTNNQSCERQERDLLEYAKRAGFEVCSVFKETASGIKENRRERKRAMALAQDRRIDAILVTELTRWGRSTIDLMQTIQELSSWNVSLIAQTGFQFDMTTAQGKLLASLMASLAEFERDLLKERVRSGLAAAKANGKKLGRQVGDRPKSDKAAFKVIELFKALHDVTLSPFFIMAAAVTQENYVRVMGKNPSKFKEKKYCEKSFKEITVNKEKIAVCPDHPVEQVSYTDAQEFAQAMNKIDPLHEYSLPTEAQLEVAFRGRTSTAYVNGNDPNDKDKKDKSLGDYVWYYVNSNNQTQPVNGKSPNAFGVYSSSVGEWANDWYSNYIILSGVDPQGPSSGWNRVFRGGGWNSVVSNCRSANRNFASPGYSNDYIGFRLVRTNS